MYDTLKRLYQSGKIDNTALDSAVAKGWITTEQAQEIRRQQQAIAT